MRRLELWIGIPSYLIALVTAYFAFNLVQSPKTHMMVLGWLQLAFAGLAVIATTLIILELHPRSKCKLISKFTKRDCS